VKLVDSGAVFQVWDEVLPELDFTALWRFFQHDKLESVHHDGRQTVWRIGDGEPLAGTHVVRKLDERGEASPLDALLGLLVDRAADFAPLVADWRSLDARTYLYPRGSGLGWHNDPEPYRGAWIFYAHPRWSAQWGGELMIAHESLRGQALLPRAKQFALENGQLVGAPPVPMDNHLDNSQEDALLAEPGVGRFVLPRPNRLVVLASGVPHRINRVSDDAGDRVRCSVAGFFV
jgi:hypothetical protein